MNKFLKISMSLAFTCISSAALAFGQVDSLAGTSSLINIDGQTHALLQGDRIEASDTITTGEDAELLIKTDDDGVIVLKANTKFVVEAYRAKGNAQDLFIVKLIKGGLRSVTGFIGKAAPKRYRVNTPTATIGVRGTDYEIEISEKDNQISTFTKVNTGEISMTNRGVSLNVAEKQYGLATASAPPQLLETPPAGLFKPSKLEDKTQNLINSLASNNADGSALQTQQNAQKLGGGNSASGETRIPLNCAGNNPAQRSLDDFIRAYERGDIAYIQHRLDPNMIGYSVFLNSMMEDANAQKQIRFLIQNRNAQCGSDLAVINFRWEKRFIDLVSFEPRLQTGQASVLTYLKAGEWRLSGITGDNPFASSLNASAILTVSPGQTSFASLPKISTPSATSMLTGTSTAFTNAFSGLPCTPDNTNNLCSIAGVSGIVIGTTVSCTGTPLTAAIISETGTTPHSSTGASSSTLLVTQVIPVSGSGNGQVATGTVTCQANVTYPAGAPIFSVAPTTISAQLKLINANQAGAGLVQVEAVASNGDRETLTFNETTRGTFTRTGFNVAGGAVVPNNGAITINGATTITFRHADPKTGKVTTTVFRVTP